jgi:hypothetical protein
MASVAEQLAGPKPQVVNAAIIGATIIDPKIVDGKIVDGRIIGGSIVHSRQLGLKAIRALNLETRHFHTEIIAVLGLGLALLLMYVL